MAVTVTRALAAEAPRSAAAKRVKSFFIYVVFFFMVISLHRQSGAESIVVCYSSVGSSSGISSASVAWSTPVESYTKATTAMFSGFQFSARVYVYDLSPKYILRSFESFAVGSVD